MLLKKTVLCALTCLLMAAAVRPAGAAGTAVGTSAVLFTAIDPDARGASLGGSAVALSADASAVYWNPGSLAAVPGSSLVFAHMNWLGLFNYEFAAFSVGLGAAGSFGAGVSYLRNDDFREADPSGANAGRVIRFENVVATVSYARKFFGLLSPGVSFKILQQNYYQDYSLSWLADVGVFAGPFKGLSLGASALNLGPSVSFKSVTDPVNFVIRGGAAYDREFAGTFRNMTISGSVDYDRSAGIVIHAGLEPTFAFKGGKYSLSPRAGVRYEKGLLNFAAGLGIGFSEKLRADYSLKTFSGLPFVHQFGLVISGGAAPSSGDDL
jgi:hypothetical protein